MTILSNRYSRDRFSVATTSAELPTTFVQSIVKDTSGGITVNQTTNGTSSTVEFKQGLDQLSYDSVNERVVSSKAIETSLNSLYLRDQHRISSGAENVFFTNIGSNIRFFPVWQGLKDQSQPENRDATGILTATTRIYSNDAFELEQLGSPVLETAVDYDDTTTYGLSLSVFGQGFVISEDIDGSQVYLDFAVFIDDRQIYQQEFKGESYTAGQIVTKFFEHPLEGHVGQTARACLKKKSVADETDLGFVQVQRAQNLNADGLIKPYVRLYLRTFEDKPIALQEEVDELRTQVETLQGMINSIFSSD